MRKLAEKMPLSLKITKLPQLNTVVIKQEGGHLFISVPNSIIIDKEGLLQLLQSLLEIEFISEDNLATLFKGAR